jgi:meso-butanediol dehydrogenase/(S,S)-butanediol dehydrogenase/diacetyl reductase
MELEGQLSIVTGGGRGIGRAIVLELAGMGSDILIAEVDPRTGEGVAGEVRALGRRAISVRVDVTKRADLDAMGDRAMADFGRIDVLVNNAGIYRAAAAMNVTEEHWDAIMDINAKAVFFASQAVLPHMLAAGRGNIISLASMAGKLGSPTSLPYAASKAAVISITRSLAVSFAKQGIRANCVCPGFVQTDMWRMVEAGVTEVLGVTPEEFTETRFKQIPIPRWEYPEDVARVIGFLASEKAGYITGESVNVSGGLVMH